MLIFLELKKKINILINFFLNKFLIIKIFLPFIIVLTKMKEDLLESNIVIIS
jgi:hypothetical protein